VAPVDFLPQGLTRLFARTKLTRRLGGWLLQDVGVREKTLFGSDFYMVQQDVSERAFSLNIRAALGEADFKLIAEDNPKRFLS
jgi:hypothetical protein